MNERSYGESVDKVLAVLETAAASEPMVFSAGDPDALQERTGALLMELLEGNLVEDPEGKIDQQSIQWAQEQKRTILLPSSDGIQHVVFPMLGVSKKGCIVLETALPPQTLTLMTRLLLDRLVATVERTLLVLDERKLHRDTTILLDTVLDSIPLAVITADAGGRVLLVNKNAEFLFQARRIDLLDEPLTEAIPGAAGQALTDLFLKVRTDGRVHECEINHHIDRATLNLGLTASPAGNMKAEGTGVVFICRDLRITRELQKLRELDTMKTEFVHTVTHELKTPLTAITGGLELFQLMKDQLGPDQLELLDLIQKGSDRLSALIQDILSMSRLERDSVELESKPIPLRKTIDEVIERLPPDRQERVTVVEKLKEAVVAADPERLGEVIENLVSNALKYSPPEKPVEVTILRKKTMIRVEVRDYGIGIAAKDRRHIFKKFFRSQDARTMGQEGTGLGLSITHELVRLQGGTLAFRSRRGKGTTFELELPAWKGEPHDGS